MAKPMRRCILPAFWRRSRSWPGSSFARLRWTAGEPELGDFDPVIDAGLDFAEVASAFLRGGVIVLKRLEAGLPEILLQIEKLDFP